MLLSSLAQFPQMDTFIQCYRFFRRLHPQLVGQNVATGLVLGQGRAALAAMGQQAHQLLVSLLSPGVQAQQSPGGVDCGGVVTLLGIVGRQGVQPLQG